MPYLHLDIKVKAYAAEIIVPDQYSTIQAAIDNANDLDTISVRSGMYYEHVVVNKTIAFIGEERNTVIIDGGGTGVVVNITANGVNMRDINYSILLFNTRPSTPKWNPNADVNNDQVVNMHDIQIAILNFNKHE